MRSGLLAVAALVVGSASAAAAPDDAPDVAFELRVVTVSPTPATPIPGTHADEGGVAVLTDVQLHKLLLDVQGDRRVNVMNAPKVTVRDGEPATVSATERQYFVTGLDAVVLKGQVVFVPRNTPVDMGVVWSVRGRASADRRSVAVDLKYTNTHLVGIVPLVPVVTQLTPSGGGKPVPFTQYLQAPDVRKSVVEKAGMTAPAGGHVVITGPVHDVTETTESRVPFLSDLPYVGSSFISIGYGTTAVRTYLILTARVIDSR